MAANSGGAMDWNSYIKPILSASHGSFNKTDIPDLVKAISRSKQDLLQHEAQYDSFYSSFAALSAHYLSTNAEYVSKNQLTNVSQACNVLLEFFLQTLQHFNEKSLLSQKDLMLLIKGLCKGVGFLQRSDVITLTGMLKVAKLPQASDVESTKGKPSEESRDAKRTRQDPANMILEQLTSPMHDFSEKRKNINGSSDTFNMDVASSIAHADNSNLNTKNLFSAKNVTNLQLLNAGDVLISMCLELPYLRRYVTRCTDALNDKGFVLPVTMSDATSTRSSFQMLFNDINIVWHALSLPILEPLHDDRLASLTTVVTSCMYSAITVAMANGILIMSGSTSSKASAAKDDDLDSSAVGIVEKSMQIFNEVSLAILNSTRAGGHNLQNLQMTIAWTLLNGLQHMLYMAPSQVIGTDKSKDGAAKPSTSQSKTSETQTTKQPKDSASSGAVSAPTGRQSLIKVQQGFGVLSVGLATQTLQLLIALLEDLRVEGALLPPDIDVKTIDGSDVSFSVQGRYTAWQRMKKLLSNFNLSNLMFNLAAITYRKACMLRRIQKHPPDGDTNSNSDSSSCCPDEISWSDESSPDDEDSEPILGQWFEETVSSKEPTSGTTTQSNQPLPDSTTGGNKHAPVGPIEAGNLIPEKGEPHGFVALATSVFVFMNRHILSSDCQLMRSYARGTLSEQHMIILAGIIRDLDREASRNAPARPDYVCVVSLLYEEFSLAVAKYAHNLLATGALSEPLQNLLLSQLGVCPFQQEDWPLQVYPRTLAIIAQVFILRQQREKDELKSESEAACVLIWKRFLQTLQKCILNPQLPEGATAPTTSSLSTSGSDLNVEHAQLLLFLFHSLQLMQKKTVLLDCAQAIVNMVGVVQTCMTENQLLIFSRLLLVFEYLMKNLYEAPASLIEQIQANLFNLRSTFAAADSDKDVSNKPSKFYFPCKDIDDNYIRHSDSGDIQGGIKPRFYNLVNVEVGNMDVPKLDGFSSNFLLGTPDVLSYQKFYLALVTTLGIGSQCDIPSRAASKKLSYLGQCAVQYGFTISWRLLLSLPPSVAFLQSLTTPTPESQPSMLPLSLIWIPRTAHKGFSAWLKDCLIKQGLTTQKAESLLRTLTNSCNIASYEVEQAKNLITSLLAKYPERDLGTVVPRQTLPQLLQTCILDSVIGKLQVVVDENTKANTDVDQKFTSPGVAADLLPEILQLVSLYSTFIRSSLLYQMNDAADPPGFYSPHALVAHGLTVALSSSRCTKASAIALPLALYTPAPLRTALDRWNTSSLSEFPAICAWRNAFANDPIPSESYVCAIQMCHIQTLSSQPSFNNNLALKHTLHALVRFAGSLIITCKDEKILANYVDVLFPFILDASTENLADLVQMTLSLERIIGSPENDEYLEKVFFQSLNIGNLLLMNHTDKDSGLDERIFHDLLKFIESMLDKAPGKKALEKFYGKQKDFVDILMSSSNDNLSVSYGTKVLKLFNRLFQLADKSPEDSSLEMLCSSLNKLAKVSCTTLQKWLSKIICGPLVPNEDFNALQENRLLLQSLASYIVQENSHVGEDVASALLHALTPMATQILMCSSDGVGFPELMVVMASLAGAGGASGHIPLLKSVSFWLCQCKKYLCEKDVTEKLQNGVLSGKHQTMMESVCCILSYLAGTIGALKPSSEKYLTSLRSGMTSPPPDGELSHLDIDSDWADELGQDDEDSAGEDSDEDSLSNKLCTFTVTQKEFMNQHWYHCHTCKMVDGVGVCSICAKVCHKDHDVTYAKHGSFFCDCGAKEDGSCQALVKRTATSGADSNAMAGIVPSAFSSTALPSSLRRRSSSPVVNDRAGETKKLASQEEGIKHHHALSKQLEPLRENILSSSLSLSKVATDILEMLQSLKPAIETNCYQNSPVGSNSRIQQALKTLHETDKTFETTDQLMVPTLGSQEGAFENVRMNYSGDQGQTIRQLIGAHMIRRVAMCVLASTKGKRQHLAVSHEKGKVTILQLSSLLKQADSSKRKLTLTRLSSAPVPFTVLSVAGNPCNEEFVAVCGLKDCHVLTFTSSGSTADHLALQPQPAVGNFIIKAVWLPGSQTELALVMPDFVKIYDLALDAISPQYYFLLPSGKIRDCCFAFTEDGQRHLLLMSSAGHIYTQIMCDESSAKHGPFYVTNILEVKHSDLKDSNGQFGGGGVSIYYSHVLQLLFFSYVHGKSFISPMPKMVPELQQLNAVTFKTNGGGKNNNQPLCQWAEVANHPGLVTCLTQTNNNPIVIMIKPDSISIQEIKLVTSKSKITDMVAVRHVSSSGDLRTTIILLCEDGSLRLYMANIDHTGFWLTPAHQSILPPSVTRPSKKKKSAKVGRPPGSVSFPVDFFEHCVPLNDLEFGGNDVLQIYNTQQIKHRLNTTGMYIASTKPAGFTIEATNPDPSMVMTGVRVMVGGQDIQRAPAYIEIFNRSVQVTLTRSRWFDFPLTREESLQADKKISMFFGASSYPSGVTIVDTIKIYGKSKDAFGWPEDDEFQTGSPTAAITAATSQSGEGDSGVAIAPLPLTSLDRLLAGSLELLDNCFSVMPAGEGKQALRPMALDLATQLLSLPTPQSVQQQTKGLLMALLANKVAYHNHKDQALLSDVSSCLSDVHGQDAGKQLDVESYYNLVVTARSVAVSRPQNLVRFADSLEETFSVLDDSSLSGRSESVNPRLSLLNVAERRTFLGQLMAAFWRLHDAQPCNTALAPVSQPGLSHLEAIVQALVEIIPAFASSDVDNVNLASKLYVQLLLCENPTVSFVCKQALTRALRPRYHRKVCIPSPTHANATGIAESRDDAKLSLPLASGNTLTGHGHSEMELAQEAAAAMSAGPLESLLTGQVSFSPMLDVPPDADDEAMVSLAIALSLQEESNQPGALDLQAFGLGTQRRTSSLERAQFSDTTASPGASDDEGSTAATDGSTLRTPPAEQGGSAGSESGGSGVDSITGEHNVSGRSSANGDNVPESTTTGARSETSSVGLPSTSMHPYADGCEAEAEAEMDGDTTLRLHTLRLLLLDKFLQHVPKLRDISGIRAIPFLQVILMLTSDLDGDNEKDRVALENLLGVMIGELEMDNKDAANMAGRSPRHEVQLVIMRLLSVMISRTKTTGKSNASVESSTFISNATAGALIGHGAIPYCLQVLKSLLDYWKHYQADDYGNSYAIANAGVGAGAGPPKGGLLKPHPLYPLPNMSPFFLRQYVKGHANDVFEAYPQLLTEMALRLPYQIKKMADGAASVPSTSAAAPAALAPPAFDQTWFFFLCEYMMTQQTPFVRKQVRKLLLFICGSKDRYRQLRDLYVLESNLKEAKLLCAQGGYNFQASSSSVIRTVPQTNSGVRNGTITLPYDTLITLIEHIKNCVEIATSRTLNWQHFCQKDESVLPFLVKVSFLLDEGVSPIILQLLQCAISVTPASQATANAAKTAQQSSNKQPKEQEKPAQPKEESASDVEAASAAPPTADGAQTPCANLVQQINKHVESKVLSCFVKAFLLESNQSAVRWQAHSLVLSLFTHSSPAQQEALLDLMWRLWPQLPSYVRKAAQFVDLLGYFAIRIPPEERKAREYVDRAASLLQEQNRILAYHPNAGLYTAFQALVEFDGYYLESEPCLVCNDPEVPLANVKLSALKMDSCFTTTTQIVKLIGSHVISKIVLRVGDMKRSKMVRTICFYYNNRSVQAVVELKNKPAMWHKAKRCTLAAGQTELKVEFPLPIVACNLMIEYADFYENVQASSETLQCPRCSASVPANPGVCANCGENVFQCHKCRAINYDEKDPFLCNTCGFCKYSKFDYTLTAKPCCAVDPIENEEDRKKSVATINTLLEKADRVYRQLVANKPVLEMLLARINEHSYEIAGDDGGITVGTAASAVAANNVAAAGQGVAGVNKAIQQLAQRYCGDCKSAFEDLGKIIQKVLATRKELVEYDRQQRDSGSRPAGPTTPISRESLLRSLSGPAGTDEAQNLSSGRCYGCASAATEHCITLLRALATDERTRLVQCGQGLIRELVDYNLRQGSVQVCNEVRQLLCLLTRDNPKGTEELNSIIMEKISLAHRSQMNSSDFAASVHHEMALLAASVQRYDSCWEQRLRCVMNIFLLGVNSKSPVVMETITLPCLSILQSLIKPALPISKKNKDKSTEELASVKVEGTDVRIDLQKWLAEDSHHTFERWKSRLPPNLPPTTESSATKKKAKKEESRERFLTEKYGNKWRNRTHKEVVPIKLVDSEWLRHVLFNPPSHAARQEACNMVESLCTIPTRKKEILDLLTTFLDDLGKSGESATEFLTLYQNLTKPAQWKSYLAIRGVLPHIGNLITKEISHLTFLEETTLKSDLCEGFALKMLTELLSSFIEQDNIRRHYKGRLVGTVLNGYLSLRKLVIQRTKMVDETQEKLLELLEEMTTGNEAETQAFMSVCVETVNKYPLDDYRTPVFIFERLCSIIYPEENDMGEYFVSLDKDPQQEDFLQGRMLGNPYSSNEPGVGPLMRDIKNKICQDCELVALLEDDNGMELLVNNKIISLDLPVKEVYKKVWLAENAEGEAMRVVYRMRGLLGDATEEFIESLDARSNEEIDNEEVYKMANWMSKCGGLAAMLERLGSLNDVSRGRSLLIVLLKLFGFCTEVKGNRQALVQPEMKCMSTMLHVLRLALNADGEQLQGQPGGPTITEQLLQIMETILLEASSLSVAKYTEFTETCGNESDIQFLLAKMSSPAVHNTPILQRLMRVLPFLAFASPPKLTLLVNYFKPCSDFNRFDEEHTASDDIKMECLCRMASSIEKNALGDQLKTMIIDAEIVGNALKYVLQHAPTIRSALLLDSDELKDFITKPSLKYILRMLTGLCQGHEATQMLVGNDCIPIIHRLEQVSSDEHVGSLAENLMEALRENPNVVQKIEDARKLTRAEKKRLAMAMREKQLAGLGMSTNEKGQVTAKSPIMQQMEDLGEETGLVCVICREGYRFQPTKVLGIYTYTKRCNADEFENKPRKTPAYSTVTHFNVTHVDCHVAAVRLARGRDEWESAALQNANTRCNGLLPLWGPQVPESAFASCLARHNTYLQECTGHRDIGYPSTCHDLKLLIMRFANEKSFSEDSGGGGPQSNLHLVPYLIHMALYVINTTRTAAKEDKNVTTFLELTPDKWVENSFEADGPLFLTALSLCIRTYAKWQETRVEYLKRLLILAHARHISPQGATRLTDKEAKEYSVYKPVLIFFGMVNGLFSYLFKKVTATTDADLPSSLAEYIRNNDQLMLEGCDKLLSQYQDELLPCQSFAEFCDVVGLLEEIPNPDEYLTVLLAKLP